MEKIPNSLKIFMTQRKDILVSFPTSAKAVQEPTAPFSSLSWIWHTFISSAPPATHHTSPQLIFNTKYGLQIIQTEGPSLVSAQLVPLGDTLRATSDDGEVPTFHYRIFPDWRTSFIWKDPEFFEKPGEDSVIEDEVVEKPEEDSVIEDEVVEKHFSKLAPFFFAWRRVYETEFEKREIHLGNDSEVFLSPESRIAWCVEGCLMACWLVLQSRVDSVQYSSEKKVYMLRKENVDKELQRFFLDMDTSLTGNLSS
jgi:hypothetical protein